MKNSDPRLFSEVLIDCPNDAAVVLRHHGYVMVDQFSRWVGAMASEVEEDNVELPFK